MVLKGNLRRVTSYDIKTNTIKQEQPSEIHDLDSLFAPLGGFGVYQLFNITCILTMVLLYSTCSVGYIMTTVQLKHRCLIPECEGENATYGNEEGLTWLPSAIPTDASGRYDSCLRYHINHSTADGDHICSNANFSSHTYKCDHFVYDTDEWTIHREDWGIHCDADSYLLNLVGSLNNIGQASGIFSGYLQDRFGRKSVLVTSALLAAVVGIMKSFSVNYLMMVLLEVVENHISICLCSAPFVLALEMVAPSKRGLAGMILIMGYPSGAMIFGFVQYLTLNWRTTILICYTPHLLAVCYYWILPESVRWLLTNKRYDEVTAVLKKMARMNGKKLPKTAVQNIINFENSKNVNKDVDLPNIHLLHVFKSSVMRWRVISNLFVRMMAIFAYFGLTITAVTMTNRESGDKFLNFILAAMVEIAGFLTAFFFMNRAGRKATLSMVLYICSCACLINAFLPSEWTTAKLVFLLLGKLAASGAGCVTNMYSAEIFPTFVRSTLLSAGVQIGKLACVFAPQVPLLADIYEPLPILIFGASAFLGALAVVILPETLNKKLPDTIEEAENL